MPSELARGVTWFVRHPDDHRPTLLQLPASWDWFVAPDGIACWLLDTLWVPIHDRVAAIPLAGPVHAICSGHTLVVRGADGATVTVKRAGMVLSAPTANRVGLHTTLVAHGAQWRGPWPLADGAQRSERAWPYLQGHGVIWADSGWAYRQGKRQAPFPVGPIRADEALAAGPHGAMLVGDEVCWHRVAAPDGTMVALDAPLARSGPLRWSPDGLEVAGLSSHDPDTADTCVASTRTGRTVHRVPYALPITHDCVTVRGETDVPGAAMAAGSVVHTDALLGGPGGRVWDLKLAAACTPVSILGSGPQLPFGKIWLTHTGDGTLRWIHPRKGRTLAEVTVPLTTDDDVALLTRQGDEAIVHTVYGRTHTLVPPAGHDITPNEAKRAKRCPRQWRALGLRRVLRVRGRVFAWNDDGLLVALPADALD